MQVTAATNQQEVLGTYWALLMVCYNYLAGIYLNTQEADT